MPWVRHLSLALVFAALPATGVLAQSQAGPRAEAPRSYDLGGGLTTGDWLSVPQPRPVWEQPDWAMPVPTMSLASSPSLATQFAEATRPVTTAAAPPASGTRPAGEPILNSDYWLNYFWDIPRFFTAPLRFDTADWIKTGAFLVAAGSAYLYDEHLQRFFHDHHNGATDSLAAIGYRLGDSKTIIAGSLGSYVIGYGVASMNQGNDYKIRETSLLVLQSFAFSQLLAEGTKKIAGRERPNASEHKDDWRNGGNSFFSGHAVNAFSTAAVISEQYDDVWVAPVAYGLAGLVAWSRLNDNAHWTSDVVVGAGVGYAVGKLVAHFSPFRGQQDMSLTPWGLPGGGGLQLGFNF